MRPSLFAAAALRLSSLAARADAVYTYTYTYTGQSFTSANAPYTTSDRVMGELVFSSPLGPNLAYQLVIPESYSFYDGVETLDNTNSYLGHSDLSTDAKGNITRYGYHIGGFVRGAIGVSSVLGDQASISAGIYQAISFTPGAFTRPDTQVGATPEPSSFGLLATSLLGVASVLRKCLAKA